MASPSQDLPAEAGIGAKGLVNPTSVPFTAPGDGNLTTGEDSPDTKPSSLVRPDENDTNGTPGGNPDSLVDDHSQVLSRIKKLQDELVKVERKARLGQKLETVETKWDNEFDRLGSDAEQRNWTLFQQMRAQSYVKDTTAFAVGKEWIHESEESFIWNMLEREEHDKQLTERRAQWEAKRGITQPGVDDSQKPAWLQPNPHVAPPRPFQFPAFLDPLSAESRFNSTAEAQGYDGQERSLRFQIHELVRQKHDAFTRWKNRRPPLPPPGAQSGKPIDVWPRAAVNYVQWGLFRYCSPSTAFESEQRKDLFAIDVLDGEPDLSVSRDSYHLMRRAMHNDGSRMPVRIPKMAQGIVPERIRLNGPQFAQTFRILGCDYRVFSPEQMILLQPYRLLVYYGQDIRKRYTALKEKLELSSDQKDKPLTGDQEESESHNMDQSNVEKSYQESTDTGAKSSQNADTGAKPDLQARDTTQHDSAKKHQGQPEDKPNEETEETKFPLACTENALVYLDCLIDFMDTTISIRRNYVQGAECRKIHFRDLWYLFNPGDEVVRDDGKQVYKVIEVTNPTHRASSRNFFFDFDDEDHSRYFQVSCVFVDFDGKRIGPVSTKFVIKAFAGERSVDSLEIYPLRLHRNTASHERKGQSETSGPPHTLRQQLIKRGKKFFQAACMKLENTFYDGPTAGGDEVESQVVVDFETALSSGNNFDELLVPKLESLLGDADDTSSTSSDIAANVVCMASCCDTEPVFDDSFVDEKRKEEYIDSLIPKNTYAKLPSVAIYPRSLDDTTDDNALTDDEFLLMSYRVFAFILRTRKWGE